MNEGELGISEGQRPACFELLHVCASNRAAQEGVGRGWSAGRVAGLRTSEGRARGGAGHRRERGAFVDGPVGWGGVNPWATVVLVQELGVHGGAGDRQGIERLGVEALNCLYATAGR